MASKIAESKNYDNASGTTLDGDTALDVQVGDLLIWEYRATVSAPADLALNDQGSGEAATAGTAHQYSSGRHFLRGYLVATSANNSYTPRVYHSNAGTYRYLIVTQYRPSSGKSFSLDVNDSYAAGTGVTVTSPTFSTTGDDEVVDVAIGFGGGSLSAIIIDGAAPDESDIQTYLGRGFKIFSATLSSVTAGGTTSGSGVTWGISVMAFKAESSGALLFGDISASSAASAELTVSKLLSAVAPAESAQSAALTVANPLSGAALAASAVSASLSVAKTLVGFVAAAAASAGSLLVGKLLSGASSSLSALSGALESGASLAGGSAASSSASGALFVSKLLSAAASAVASLAASLQVGDSLYGSVFAVSSAAGRLSTAPLYGAVPISLGEFTFEGPVIVFDGSSPSLAFSFESEAIAFGEEV